MSLIKRVWFAVRVNIAMALLAIIHFRIGVDYLYPLATEDFQGVFSQWAAALENIVPIAIAVIVVATWAWVIYGTVQEEQKRAVRVR